MDLLDEIDDDACNQFKGYDINLDTQIDERSENEDETENEQVRPSKSALGMKIDVAAISKSLQKAGISKLGDLSILDKVKRRLYGEQVGGDIGAEAGGKDTESNTTPNFDALEFSKSILQAVDSNKRKKEEKQEIQRLPQLSVEDADIASVERDEPETQIISKGVEGIYRESEGRRIETRLSNETQLIVQPSDGDLLKNTQKIQPTTKDANHLFVADLVEREEEKESTAPLSKEERQAKISMLADRKRKERLAREKEQEQLEAEITRTSLTDEENDLIDAVNDTVVTSKPSAEYSSKQMKEIEEFLSIQKREKNIQPEFQKKVLFTKEKLLSAFDDEDENDQHLSVEERSSQLELEYDAKSSPVTSPVQISSNKRNNSFSLSERESDDEINVLDLIKNKPKPLDPALKRSNKNPIELYAQNLKKRLSSSPTKDDEGESNAKKMIQLDSDSERIEESLTYSSANINHELKEVPQLTKEEKLTIKQKFSKKKLNQQSKVASTLPKNMRNFISNNLQSKESKRFLNSLKKANISQLQAHKQLNPNHELIEEMEKDEEVMGSLLEREFERARNIRKKEKMRERAALALLSKNSTKDEVKDDEDENSYSDEGEVPDSDIGSDDDASNYVLSQDDEDDINEKNEINDEDDDIDYINSRRKPKKLILSDDDNDNAQSQKQGEYPSITNEDSKRKRNDDSYMFGAKDIEHGDSLGNDEIIKTINTQDLKKVFGDSTSLTQAFRKGSQIEQVHNDIIGFEDLRKDDSLINEASEDVPVTYRHENEGYELFQNLKLRENTSSSYSEIPEDRSISLDCRKELPSFQDLTQTTTQPDSISTQIDAQSTQIDDDTSQIDQDTQLFKQINHHMTEKDEDDDFITPLNFERSRKLIRKNNNLADIEENEEEQHEEDPEIIKQRIKMFEDKLRRKELKLRKNRKELERKGITNMVEGEAEESEDEWHGLGGIDDDLSDEQANSEDEKMIDNNFNIDLNNEEVRKKFMEQYQISDQKELEKLLDDIKNHRLTKRAAGNGFDIELSDEEDEMLMRYRNQKLKEQQERLISNKKLHALSKNEKSKAFFASIEDPTLTIKIDDADNDNDNDNQTINEDPFKDDGKEGEKENEEDDAIDKEAPIKKTIRIEESFVQKQLSFLSNNNEDDFEYNRIQKISRFQHGFNSSDEEIDDLQTLKTKSLNNLNTRKSQSPIEIEDNISSRKRAFTSDADTDEDADLMPVFKKPSIIKSFKSFNEQQGVQIKDGKQQFSGVTISRQYKVASGSKASITYLSRNNSIKKQIKSLKEKRIEKSLTNAKRNNSKLFTNDGFDN